VTVPEKKTWVGSFSSFAETLIPFLPVRVCVLCLLSRDPLRRFCPSTVLAVSVVVHQQAYSGGKQTSRPKHWVVASDDEEGGKARQSKSVVFFPGVFAFRVLLCVCACVRVWWYALAVHAVHVKYLSVFFYLCAWAFACSSRVCVCARARVCRQPSRESSRVYLLNIFTTNPSSPS